MSKQRDKDGAVKDKRCVLLTCTLFLCPHAQVLSCKRQTKRDISEFKDAQRGWWWKMIVRYLSLLLRMKCWANTMQHSVEACKMYQRQGSCLSSRITCTDMYIDQSSFMLAKLCWGQLLSAACCGCLRYSRYDQQTRHQQKQYPDHYHH